MFRLFGNNGVHINELDSLLNEIDLIDIREPYEFKRGSIASSKNIPMGELLSAPDHFLKKDQKYYIMCQSGGRSSNAVSTLIRAGYDVVNVLGGFAGYSGKNKYLHAKKSN